MSGLFIRLGSMGDMERTQCALLQGLPATVGQLESAIKISGDLWIEAGAQNLGCLVRE
jgi:hypothetical protein